jgi:3-methyladenine DNA glycosylase AlkD
LQLTLTHLLKQFLNGKFKSNPVTKVQEVCMDKFILQNWTQNDYDSLILFLKSRADFEYKKFQSSLIPTVEKDYIIGIRLPILRKIATAISKGNVRSFLTFVKDNYYEEAMLYGIVLSKIKTKSYEDFCCLYDDFVPKINNWAVCDTCSGKSCDFRKYKKDYFSYIEIYLNSKNPWAIRYGIITMFQYKKEPEYIDKILLRLNNINSENYYVKMAKGWLTAELFIFHKTKVVNFLLNNNYDKETLNMTFSKLRDSYRVSATDKAKLKNLKAKIPYFQEPQEK